jgi:GMP reductase
MNGYNKMLINDDIKLDYSDVLIRPKRSTLKSRKEVDLIRTTKFVNSKQVYSGVPIMAANMDGVGTFEMADKLSK